MRAFFFLHFSQKWAIQGILYDTQAYQVYKASYIILDYNSSAQVLVMYADNICW